jgi:hypothetical protein|tara:strand:+ start:272 stop:2260 length:1989 start_codon:yes stop_codon:yes gene_type:complete
MATPLIRIPQEQGGTMYAFANAARDLTRAYYNPDINFEFSKFALIDLPVYADFSLSDVNDPHSGPNYIKYTNLYEGGGGENASPYSDVSNDGNGNVHFAQTFQSYALNLENMLLNPEVNDDFDDVLFQSDAEKIFFKYLYHINAIRVRTATSQEVSTGFSRMIELDDSTQAGSEYSQVIKYIGNIDVTNDKNYQGQQYNEIFVNVPSSVGYTPEVLLETSKFNTNNIKFNPGSEVEGRTSDDIHPNHPLLDLQSYGDQDDGTYNTNENEIPTFGIDFNASAYSKIINDPKLDTVLDYSKRGGDFRFNAILVYYDLYSKSNIGNKATNLYGIILLDNWKEDTSNDGWYIPELTKYKPNEVTGLNGNAFALKLNLKFNSSLDNVGVEKNVNDYSTFSMDIFLDTTSALENAVQLLKDANSRYIDISNKVEMLESFFLNSENLQGISTRLDLIERDVENATLNFQDERSIMDLITDNSSRLNQVISGVIPTELQYNTDVLESGNTGVSVDKSSSGKVKISNVNYGYSLSPAYVFDTISNINERTLDINGPFLPSESSTKAVWQRLKEYDNLVRVYTAFDESFDSNLNIYLDDTVTTWKKGQVVRVTFKNKIKNLQSNSITMWTDKEGGWSQKISISASSLLSATPYIEIVCVDEINKTFEYDILR